MPPRTLTLNEGLRIIQTSQDIEELRDVSAALVMHLLSTMEEMIQLDKDRVADIDKELADLPPLENNSGSDDPALLQGAPKGVVIH